MATYPNPLTVRYMDKAIKERPTSEAIRQAYIGLSLVPLKSVLDYELTWDIIKAQNHLAGAYGHTGVPIPGDSPDFKQLMADIINIMASRVLDDQTIMTLRDPGEPSLRSNVIRSARAKATGKLSTLLGECDDEVEASIEYLIMNALQGSITWPPTDASGNVIVNAPAYWGDACFTLSMGFRAAFVQNISTLSGWNARAGGGVNWQNASADPMLDLEVIAQNVVELTGMPMEGATVIMSRSVLSWMATRPNVLLWFRGTDKGQRFIDTSSLKTFLETKLGYNLRLYDSRWTYALPTMSASGQTENSIKFLREGLILVIPPGALGSDVAYFATAPTSGPNDAWQPGKYTWHEKIKRPPWTHELGVGIKGFPIMKQVNMLGVYDVFA